MLKGCTVLSALLLALYCAFGFYLPSMVQEKTLLQPNSILKEKVEAEAKFADESTLRSLVKMMLEDLNSEHAERNKVQIATIGFYTSYNQILLGLLVLHFALLFQLLAKRKPNKLLN